jgi:biotin operon repressor
MSRLKPHQQACQVFEGHAHTSALEFNSDDTCQAVGTVGFDFDEIDRRLGFEQADEPVEFADMTAAFSLILGWMCGTKTGPIRNSGWRAQALLWLLDPEQSQFGSLTEIAEAAGVTKQAVSKALVELRDECGFLISAGKRQSARESYRQAQNAAIAAGCHSRDTRHDALTDEEREERRKVGAKAFYERKKAEKAEEISMDAVAG